jgi:hypothetical protein
MLQKDSKQYYKAKIIYKQTNCGILASCYVGYWFATQGVLIELHKFWFCHDDLMCCVGGTNMKYAFDRPTLPSIWHVQVGTNLIQIEVVALEEAGSLLLEELRCLVVNQVGDDIFAFMNHLFARALWNLFGDGTFAHAYKPLDLDVWPKSRNGKKIIHFAWELSIM